MANDAAEIQARAAEASAALKGKLGNIAQSCPKVTLEIGVFFDGTLNNAQNAVTGGGNGSYANARSNVALLHRRYKDGESYYIRNGCGGYSKKCAALYVPGPGTVSGGDDDLFQGNGLGMGSNGVESRVYEACLDVGEIVGELSPGIEPEEIVMDVFGFSRGAAAARYFVNCFRQGFVEYYQNYINLKRAYLPRDRKVRFRFIGIFDTVAAIGIGTNDDNGPVNVHLNTAQAQEIFHLTALNEYRKNFRLNHNMPGGGGTQALPGAHSDIGGGYRGTGDEVAISSSSTFSFFVREAAEAHRQRIIERGQKTQATDVAVWVAEGWLEPGDIDAAITHATPVEAAMVGSRRGGMMSNYSYRAVRKLSRPWVRPGLSRIPLRIMYDRAVAAGVPFLSLPDGGEYAIPPDLKSIAQKMIDGDHLNGADTRFVLRNYGHVSANEDSLGMGAEPNHRRSIDLNRPELAK